MLMLFSLRRFADDTLLMSRFLMPCLPRYAMMLAAAAMPLMRQLMMLMPIFVEALPR